jgi:hypothetical protein
VPATGIAPFDTHVQAREAAEVIRHAMAVCPVYTWEEARGAPIDQRVLGEDRRESGLNDGLSEQAVHTSIDLVEQVALDVGRDTCLEAPPVVAGVVVSG